MVSKKNKRNSNQTPQNQLNTLQNQQFKQVPKIYQNEFQNGGNLSQDDGNKDGRDSHSLEMVEPLKNQFVQAYHSHSYQNLKIPKEFNKVISNEMEICSSETPSPDQISRANQLAEEGFRITKRFKQNNDHQNQFQNYEIKDGLKNDNQVYAINTFSNKQFNQNNYQSNQSNKLITNNEEKNKQKYYDSSKQPNKSQCQFETNVLGEMNYDQSQQKLKKKNSCSEFSQNYSPYDTPDKQRMQSSWNNQCYSQNPNFCDSIQQKQTRNNPIINQNQYSYQDQIKKDYKSNSIRNSILSQSFQIQDDSSTRNLLREENQIYSQTYEQQYKQPQTNQQKETLICNQLKNSSQSVDNQKDGQTKEQQNTKQSKQQKKNNKNKKTKTKNENKIIIKKQQSLEISDRSLILIQNDSKVTKDDTDINSKNNESTDLSNNTNLNKMNSQNTSSSQSPHTPSLQKEKSLNSEEKDHNTKEQEEDSLGIFRCPIVLEKYNIKLWIIYIDNLIEVMLKLPIELIKILTKYILLGHPLQRKDLHMWVHFLMILIPVLIFTDNLYIIELKELFDVSYWYHAFRGQSTLKLYGVLMTADVVDKMFCTFGEYLILDVLWQKLPKSSILSLIKYLIPVIFYVFLHSLVLFLSVIGYNVILNSDISFLYVMVFVHNSMKLKSSIFKKFTQDGYTSQTHADLRARFSKCYYVFLIWASMRGFQSDILEKLICFLGSEVIIEWVKHIFLMLLNNLKIPIIESINKYCKIFVAQVRIIPAFQTQEIVINKAMQTFQERENYLAQTPFISPSLKIGFRVNFLAFHHAVIIIKFFYPLMVNHFTYHNFWVCLLYLRLFQVVNDLLIYKFCFNHNEIIQLYTLKNRSLFRTLFQKIDLLIIAHGLFSFYQVYQFQLFSLLVKQYTKYDVN